MPRQPVPTRVVNSGPFVLLTGAVGTVIPFFAFVLSSDVRNWVEANGMAVFWIGLAAVTLLAIALEVQRLDVEPDERDAELMRRFRDDLGGDGDTMRWLRDWFAPNRFSEPKWHDLEEVYRQWSDDNSRRFRDKKAQAALEDAIGNLGAFISRTGNDTWPRENREKDAGTIGLPPEWKDHGEMRDRYYGAVKEIEGSRDEFLRAHAELLRVAHDRGL